MNQTEVRNKFQGLLRKSGSKATASRILVLRTLKKNKNPMSVQEVIDLLDKQMDQATVYRIFKALKEKGLIRQIDLRHNHAHYEIATDKEHHHLICTDCGRIEDVYDCEVKDAHSLILRHSKYFSKISQHALEFYGVCKVCVKKS